MLLFSAVDLCGQYQFELMKMSEGIHSGVWFDVSARDDKDVEDVWKDYMEERSLDIERNRRPREHSALDLKGPEVSALFGMDMFMQTEEVDTAIRVKIWLRQGGDFPDFWGEEKAQSELTDLLDGFRLELKEFLAQQIVEEEEKVLSDMERDLSRLEKLKERYEDRIVKARESIEENEKNIVDNKEEQSNLQKDLEQQRQRVDELKEKRDKLKSAADPQD
jgi:DNA polymerase III delta prime subunit